MQDLGGGAVTSPPPPQILLFMAAAESTGAAVSRSTSLHPPPLSTPPVLCPAPRHCCRALCQRQGAQQLQPVEQGWRDYLVPANRVADLSTPPPPLAATAGKLPDTKSCKDKQAKWWASLVARSLTLHPLSYLLVGRTGRGHFPVRKLAFPPWVVLLIGIKGLPTGRTSHGGKASLRARQGVLR